MRSPSLNILPAVLAASVLTLGKYVQQASTGSHFGGGRGLAATAAKRLEPERRATYQGTRETLRSSCTQTRRPEVAEYCRQQADFIKRLPECDRECRDLAARFAPQPSR